MTALKTLEEWEKEMLKTGVFYGIPIARIKKLYDLFMEKGFDLREESDWKKIKRYFFNITEEDLK